MLNNLLLTSYVDFEMLKHRIVQISTLLLVVPFFCAAQVEVHSTILKNEVGVSLVSGTTKYGLEYTRDYYINLLNGIRYKRHLGHHAVRLGGEYRNSYSVGQGDFWGESRYVEGKFNLGYQLTFSDKSVKPYIAVDFIYLISKFNSDFEGGYAGLYSRHDLQIVGLGYAPALGIYFRVAKSLSISWEGNAEFLWITEQGTNIRSDPHNFQSRTTYPVNRSKHYWLLNPLKSVSFNYGF